MNCQCSSSAALIVATLVCEGSYTAPIWSRIDWLEMPLFVTLLVLLLLAAIFDARTRLIPNVLIAALIASRLIAAAAYGASLGGDATRNAYPALTSFVEWLPMVMLGMAADALGALAAGLTLLIPVVVLVSLASRVRGQVSFGGGDAKLIFCIGIWYGVSSGAYAVAIGSLCAVVHCVVRGLAVRVALDSHRAKRKRPPFGDQLRSPQASVCDAQILGQTFPFAPYLLAGTLIVAGVVSSGAV